MGGNSTPEASQPLQGWDWVLVVLYLILLFVSGTLSSTGNRGSLGGYFLAEQRAPFWLVALSMFSSNIGAGHFVGLSGSGASSGLAVAAYELTAVYYIILLGWVFFPVYRASGIYTLPQYLKMRFGGNRIKIYIAVLSLILHVFTKSSVELYAGTKFIELALPNYGSTYVWAVVLAVIAALFTVLGGMAAVMSTDGIQAFVMLTGGSMLLCHAMEEVGGYEAIFSKFNVAISETAILNSNDSSYQYRECGRPPWNWYRIVRPADDKIMPWTGFVFGLTVSGIWYFCCDQVMVQRILAAKDVLHAKMGMVVMCHLKCTPLFLMVIPGMIARVLYPTEVACVEPRECQQLCGKRSGCSDTAYALLVLRVMPEGFRGLMVAVILAALISTLTSVINSTSTIASLDLWTLVRPDASDVELMLIGRLAMVLLLVVSIACIPLVAAAPGVYAYIQNGMSCLSPPIAAAFVVAVFWDRATERAVFWSLITGLVVGMTRFIWELVTDRIDVCGEEGNRTKDVVLDNLTSLNFGTLLFFFCVFIIIAVSLQTRAPKEDMYMGKTFYTRFQFQTASVSAEATKPVVSSGKAKLMAKRIEQCNFNPRSLLVRNLLWVCGIEHVRLDRDSMSSKSSGLPMFQLERDIREPRKMEVLMNLNMAMALVTVSVVWLFLA